MLLEYGPGRYIAHMTACMNRPDRVADMAGVSVPTLVIMAADDRLVLPSRQRQTADAVRGATLREVKKSGHMLPMERPEEVACCINEWWPQID